jgi:hypothetical protein
MNFNNRFFADLASPSGILAVGPVYEQYGQEDEEDLAGPKSSELIGVIDEIGVGEV